MAKTILFDKKSDAQAQLKELRARREALTEEINKIAVEALKEVCTEIFRANSDLTQFAWVQYGGEYNDEGPYHGINNVGINDEIDEESGDFNNHWMYEYNSTGLSAEIKSKIEALGTDIVMEALGTAIGGVYDGAGCDQVTVTRGGISVDPFDNYY